MRARILFVIPSIPLGGMERASIRIATIFRDAGADVLVVTESNYGQAIDEAFRKLGFSCAPVSSSRGAEDRPRFPRNLKDVVSLTRAWFRVALQLTRIYRRYRPTHIYLTNFAYVFYCLPLLIFGKGPSILRTPDTPARTLTGVRQRLHDWLWRAVVARLCDVIVCNSEFTRTRLNDLGITNVRMIRNALPYRDSNPAPLSFEMNRARFNVVYVGSVRPNKGVHLLIEAARSIVQKFEDVDFYIVGPDEWQSDYAGQLRRQVKEYGLEERIRFTGECDNVAAVFANASLHVCPSIHDDSFPNVLLEAKLGGVPSVVFPRGGLPEAIEQGVDGFVCATDDVRGLVEGLTFFVSDRQRLTRASAAARSLERFSIERARENWERLFADISPEGENSFAHRAAVL